MNRNLIMTLDAQKNSFLHKCYTLMNSGLSNEVFEANSELCQLLTQLVNVETCIVKEIEQNVSAPEKLTSVGLASSIKGIFGFGFTPVNVPLNRSDKTFEELVADWDAARIKLDEIDLQDEQVLAKTIYHHNRFGNMHFGHVLRLLHKNYNRFLTQASTALA